MDDQRFGQLERKRDSEGLSDEEADELGRMMAERAGKPYANAEDRPSLQDEPVAWEEEAKREDEAGYLPPKGAAEDPAP